MLWMILRQGYLPHISPLLQITAKYVSLFTYGESLIRAALLASRRGQGRPPEGSPSRSWGFSHAISSFLGWSTETQALPPLALSGQHASRGDVQSDGEVHYQPAISPDATPSNGRPDKVPPT